MGWIVFLVIIIILGIIYLTGFFGNNKNPDPRKWEMNPVNWFTGWKCDNDSYKCKKIHTLKPKYTTEADCKQDCTSPQAPTHSYYQCVNGSCVEGGNSFKDDPTCDNSCSKPPQPTTYYKCDDNGSCIIDSSGATGFPNDPTCDNSCSKPSPRMIYYNEIVSIQGLENALLPDIEKYGGSKNDVRYILLPNLQSIGLGKNRVGNEQIITSDGKSIRKAIEENVPLMIGTIGTTQALIGGFLNRKDDPSNEINNTTSIGGYDPETYETVLMNPLALNTIQWLSYGTPPNTFRFLTDVVDSGLCKITKSCTYTFKLKSSSNGNNQYNLIPLDNKGNELSDSTPLNITIGCQGNQTMYDLNLEGDDTIKKPGCWFNPNQLGNYNWKLSACQTGPKECPKGMKFIEPENYNPPKGAGIASQDGAWELNNMNMNLDGENTEGDDLKIIDSTIDGKKCPVSYDWNARGSIIVTVPGAGCVPDDT